MKRVQALLQTHDAMQEALKVVFGETDDAAVIEETGGSVIRDLKGTLDAQREAQRQAELEAVIDKEAQRRKEQEEHQARLDEETRNLHEARLQREREVQELARAAELSRLARQRAEQEQQRQREERERIDREWEASITKGEQGVREYFVLLRASTSAEDFTTAVTALHALFSQIVSKPEETQYRRVRRDHPKFTKDIGRHPGGKELLIASGFRLGKIDEVPSYISTEPNLEKDMDAWGDWFDLKKKTLEIVEEEMAK
jgi:chemotaxis protein histidine kinase CheA